MHKNHSKQYTNASGFTLTELIIATAILGCLAALAATRYSTSLEQTRYRRALANLISIRTAANMYKEHSFDEDYPPTVSGLTSINNTFHIHLSDPDFIYTFTNNGDGTFTIIATRTNSTYTILLDQTLNPPTCAGACPCSGTCS